MSANVVWRPLICESTSVGVTICESWIGYFSTSAEKRDPGFGTDCRSISNMIQVVAEGLFCRSKTIRNHRKAKTLDHRPVLEKAIDDFVVGTCPQVALLTLDYSLTQGYC